jgi:hypothetical protein
MPHEIVADSVRLSRADNVGEAKCPAKKVEHMTVGCNQSLAGQLTCSVGRNWNTWSLALRKIDGRVLAVDAAA